MSQRCEGVLARAPSAVVAIGLCLALAASCARSAIDGGAPAALESLPSGLPNLHVALVSSDLGAPSDALSAGDSGVVGLDGGGEATGATDAATGVADGGNMPGTGGTNGPVSPPAAHGDANGLVAGGCDLGASDPGAAGLTLLIAFLIAGRRKLTGNLRQR